jgi:hypothetical protein
VLHTDPSGRCSRIGDDYCFEDGAGNSGDQGDPFDIFGDADSAGVVETLKDLCPLGTIGHTIYIGGQQFKTCVQRPLLQPQDPDQSPFWERKDSLGWQISPQGAIILAQQKNAKAGVLNPPRRGGYTPDDVLESGIKAGICYAIAKALADALSKAWDWARTRTRSNKKCDPAKCAAWVAGMIATPGLTRSAGQPNTGFGAYQLQQTGPIEYHVAGGGAEIWADGIRTSDCYLLEAKHVGNPRSSPYLGTAPSFLQPSVDRDIDGEIRRYTAIINDPQTPFVGLEIITNDAGATPYLQGFLSSNGTRGGRVVIRP